MKKTLIFILVLSLCLCFASCGKNDTDSKTSGTGTTSGTNSTSNTSRNSGTGGIYSEAGMELQDFYDAFNKGGMGKFEGEINDGSDKDMLHMDAKGDSIIPSGEIVLMAGLDFLESGDNPKEEKIDGENTKLREKSGNEIKFNIKEVKTSSFGPSKAGDILLVSGKLDISTNTLTMEKKTERDGTVIERSVSEIIMIADGSFIGQTIMQEQKPEDDRIEYIGEAYFTKFDKTNLDMIYATFSPNLEFTFTSIVGNKNATLESMSENYTKVRKFNVKEGGVFTATKY